MKKIYRVTLAVAERNELEGMLRAGKSAARTLTRARILLKADQSDDGPAWPDSEIARALDIHPDTVADVRRRPVEGGLRAALQHKPQVTPRTPRKLDGRGEAALVKLACSKAPLGYASWTLRLLADELVRLEVVDSISIHTVGRTLKKTNSSRGKTSSG